MWLIRIMAGLGVLFVGWELWLGFKTSDMSAVIWGDLGGANREDNALGFWVRAGYNVVLLAVGALLLIVPA